ncbi:MAG: hypothetical protein V3S83_12385 [Gemmatimonadota bacterium]
MAILAVLCERVDAGGSKREFTSPLYDATTPYVRRGGLLFIEQGQIGAPDTDILDVCDAIAAKIVNWLPKDQEIVLFRARGFEYRQIQRILGVGPTRISKTLKRLWKALS